MGPYERIRREWAYVRGAIRTLRAVAPLTKNRSSSVGGFLEALCARHGDRPALVSDREAFTYRALDARANRYARWAKAQGLGKGDVVALLMPNRPEYVCVWFGLAKAGVVTALLNTNLVGNTLAHCVSVAAAKAIIVDAAALAVFETARPFLRDPLPLFVHGDGGSAAPRIDLALSDYSDLAIPATERPSLTSSDRCLYIYTSGTTGLPKAANLNHYRVQLIMLGFSAAVGARAEDCVYDCMPMYHTVGGVCAVGVALVKGGRLVIREKFSAREFWPDIARHGCTVFCYVGELCRYLLAAPAGPEERSHRLRVIFGNGLRPDIWIAFRDRFRLPQIREFYAATESNVSMFNFDSWPGAVGRVPKWLERKFPFAVLRFDVDHAMALRGSDGFCVACGPDEVGEVVGEILDDPARPGARFEGYVNKADTERKILRNVFRKGDSYFSTGDLMRRDTRGYYYFVDRVGDTFRWKGENVSTTEVAETVATAPGVVDATAYGVAFPGADGRAGMVAIVPEDAARFDLAALRAHLNAHLPDYARPVFLRMQQQLELTSTFKQRKQTLVGDGFDPARSADLLFFNDRVAGAYVPLDESLHARLMAGETKL